MRHANPLLAGGTLGLLLLLTAASQPVALATLTPGLWEFAGKPQTEPQRLCIADMASLAQIEHRSSKCTRVVIRDLPNLTEIHYTCTGGGFGRTTLKPITPRSMKIDTQGIAGGYPFSYVLQARRVGDCPGGAPTRAH
jgi:hypothetical protein